ncbi:MAG: hypothetical protein AB4290_10035 [Spirulina sp.]
MKISCSMMVLTIIAGFELAILPAKAQIDLQSFENYELHDEPDLEGFTRAVERRSELQAISETNENEEELELFLQLEDFQDRLRFAIDELDRDNNLERVSLVEKSRFISYSNIRKFRKHENLEGVSQTDLAQFDSQREVPDRQRQEIQLRPRLFDPNERRGTARDLILLRKHQPWFLELDSIGAYTRNAFLTSIEEEDFYFTQYINAGFETQIAEKFNIRLQGEASLTRYADFSQLDYQSLGAGARFGVQVEPNFEIGLDYFSTFIFDSDYENVLDLHELSLFSRYQVPLSQRSLLYTSLFLTRTLANPDEFDRFRINGLAGIYHQISEKFSASGGLTISALFYDDYFERFLGESRQDVRVSPFVYLNYAPDSHWNINLAMQVNSNSSALDALSYTNYIPSIQMRMTYRF